MTRMNLFLLTIGALFISGVMGYKDYSTNNQLYFVVEMEASANGTSQIFFDTGLGTREKDSSRAQVQRRNFQKYAFPVPASIKSIRFDPIDVTSLLSINNAAIENAAGDKLKKFPIQSFRAVQQISKMDVSDDKLTIQTTENANDPITVIDNSSFVVKSSWIDFLAKQGWIYAGYALLIFIIFIGLAKYRPKIAKALRQLLDYAIANPRTAITFIGFIAAVVSCYPVVFFGKSFVHPVGVAALYSGPPWIPGMSFDAISEDFRGSDVGATAWAIAPDAVVQHNSLLRYFEFPFWNRYVGGGIPLFAQGQSMIGDVLHWIPVFLDGSAIGWDIKFVMSKAIFAIGMGLLVYRLTDRLLAGALIAVSSCFLGFFAWRFNHPAFFVLTYAPWVVLQWDRLGRILALPNLHTRSCVSQGLLLATVTWLQLNAGATKEGVITACFMQALGVLAFWKHISPKWGRIRPFVFACGIGFALIMITAPYWLLFLDALGKAFTNYDTTHVSTFQLWMILGFFDNFFFQRYLDNSITGPSANLFVLFFMSSALLNLRFRQSAMVYGSWGLFTLAMATAYGLIPVSILIAIPFINKIQHLGNTFSVPMVILSLIIAGYGIRDYFVATEKFRAKILTFSLLGFLMLWLVLEWEKPLIFAIKNRYIALFFMTLIGFFLLYRHAESGKWRREGQIVLACCFLALHVRHGMHLTAGVKTIDNYMMNPTERPNFSKKSDAIEYVKNKMYKDAIPTRVIGEGDVSFPGYNSRLGLEGIVPVDALRNGDFDKLLTLVDYPNVNNWGWLHLIRSDQIASRAASLDLLGIGYIVATPGTKMPQDMKLVHSSDLDVWQRETVWPRAFFVNNIIEIDKPSDILEALADKAHTPFATVESQFIPQGVGVLNNNAPYQVVPAGEYRLTNNSTDFSVEASGPGIIVLSENYYQGDFVATVNSEKVDYIRVNEASKGIWVNKAGKYEVSFTYRPEKLNQVLWICLFGLVLLQLLILLTVRSSGKFIKKNIGEL